MTEFIDDGETLHALLDDAYLCPFCGSPARIISSFRYSCIPCAHKYGPGATDEYRRRVSNALAAPVREKAGEPSELERRLAYESQRADDNFTSLVRVRQKYSAEVNAHASCARELAELKSQLAERTAEVERLKQANALVSEAVDRALRCDNWSDRLTAIRDARDRLERVMPKGSGT